MTERERAESAQQLARLIERFERWTGLDLGRGSAHVALERFLRARVPPGDPAALARYVDGIATPQHPEAVRLVDAITVCHSNFYRDPEQLAAIASVLRADLSRPAAIWVPACATGEDAYSLALVAESVGRRAIVHATDINSRALAHAVRGEYGAWSVRELPPAMALLQRPDGLYEVPPRLRRAVTFARHNLMDPTPPGTGGGWDVIVCRNVLMYLARERAEDVLRRLAMALRPGGYLFVGANDILDRPPPLLRFVRLGGRHALWRPATEVRATPPLGVAAAAPPPPPAPPPSLAVPDAPAARAVLLRAHERLERGDAAGALAMLVEMLDVDPLCIEARLLAGIAYHLEGDALQAASALRGALVLAPELWPAELYLGFALDRLGDADGAGRALRRGAALAAATPRLALTAPVAAWLESWRVDAIALGRRA